MLSPCSEIAGILPWPSVTALGRIALQNGAHGLTVHPRPDQRHIRFSDLPELRALIDDEFPQAEFNIEGYPTDGVSRSGRGQSARTGYPCAR
jgi:pyridoxine 5'-phosphate synthase PdxJ